MRMNYYAPLLAAEWAIPEQIEHVEELCADRPPLVKLALDPWRSLGGYLDYTGWQERERFFGIRLQDSFPSKI